MDLQADSTAIVFVIAGSLLVACSDPQTRNPQTRTAQSLPPQTRDAMISSVRAPITQTVNIDDPAMANGRALAVARQAPPSPRPSSTLLKQPGDAMTVDLAQRRVYLPATGWLDEQRFWDVYLHEPEKLTVAIDFRALDAMGFQRPDLE